MCQKQANNGSQGLHKHSGTCWFDLSSHSLLANTEPAMVLLAIGKSKKSALVQFCRDRLTCITKRSVAYVGHPHLNEVQNLTAVRAHSDVRSLKLEKIQEGEERPPNWVHPSGAVHALRNSLVQKELADIEIGNVTGHWKPTRRRELQRPVLFVSLDNMWDTD